MGGGYRRGPAVHSPPMHRMTAQQLATAIASGAVTAGAALDHHLDRVDRLNPRLNAVVARDDVGARARAAAADAAIARGERWGPLHGVPMTVKDSIEVAGMPTTAGAPELAEHVPAAHALSARRLVDAGAIVFGKTNLPLYAGDLQSYNDVYGTTNNPWDESRSPGGSSGGAASALAAGLTALELGSDIGGSIRNPAHYCGVYGHKPSHGLVPHRGHIPGPPGTLGTPDIAVIGPLARSAADLDMALAVLSGPDEREGAAWRLDLPGPRRRGLHDFRVAAWLDDPHCPVDAAVGDVLEGTVAALESAGVAVDRSARPDFAVAEARSVFLRLMYAVMGSGFPKPVLAAFDEAYPKLEGEDLTVRSEMVRGAALRHRHWLAVDEARQRLRAAWDEFFRRFDVLLCPAMPTVAIPHDHRPVAERTVDVNGAPLPYLEQLFWAGLAGAALLPATVAPAGLSPDGLPVGIQIVGPYLEDRTTIAFAAHLAGVIGGFTAPPAYR